MSLAGSISHQYRLGICASGPPVLPVVGAQSRGTADPAQGVSELQGMQKELQPLQIHASRGGKMAVFQPLYLN